MIHRHNSRFHFDSLPLLAILVAVGVLVTTLTQADEPVPSLQLPQGERYGQLSLTSAPRERLEAFGDLRGLFHGRMLHLLLPTPSEAPGRDRFDVILSLGLEDPAPLADEQEGAPVSRPVSLGGALYMSIGRSW
ncbi:MAG TPA: hypothetical protein ENK54_02405 [Thiotrichales bacterium]|nr:hypothetical protein [Thiotrichales bacterium]